MSTLLDITALTRRYHARLRELLGQVPAEELGLRVGGAGLTVAETAWHVCEAERWYMDLIDGGSRTGGEPAKGRDGLLAALTETEAEMLVFLESMDEAALERTLGVPAWWGEGEPQTVRLVLMHSLAHKYYHCGQLQAILHALADESAST